MSAIRRGERPADRYTVISNGFHRDHRLSFKARGIGGYLLSHAEGWETSARAIARESGCGRALVESGLRELESYGYLRRVQNRAHDGRLSQAEYMIQCTPSDEGPALDRGSVSRPRVTRPRITEPHKKNSSKNIITNEEQPSGGSLRESAREPERDPMTRRTPPQAAALPLEFDSEERHDETMTISGRQNGKATASLSAATVVAAFVDAYRLNHSGADPVKSNTGRVARDAARLLREGAAGPEELAQAATALGATPWANLPVQLSILRDRGSSNRRGCAPVAPRGSFAAGAAESHAKFLERIRSGDQKIIGWVMEDPEGMAKLIAEDPSLEAVFAAAGAA